ncbi:MAG: alginate O-acetyltransferase AlgX-related protein, partial [Pseudomonas sp.]
ADSGDALFADTEIPVALVGTSYSANPHWNFLGALQQALRSDVVNYAEDGHGPLLPMLKYLQSDAFKASAPQVLIWEFPERYLPMKSDLSDFDPQWITALKKTRNANQDLALSSNRTEH